MKSLTPPLAAVAIAVTMPLHESAAFVTPSLPKAKTVSPVSPSSPKQTTVLTTGRCYTSTFKQTPTRLKMGYQLPPSPKGPLEQIGAILPTITTGVLVALFFASPLGGAIFAIFNSLFVLAFLTPFILYAGFQIWSALNTVEAPCPSCGSSQVRVLKTGEPSMCLNCGDFVRANEKKDGVELCNNPNDIMGGSDGSLFDALFGGGGMGGNMVSDIPDVFVDGSLNGNRKGAPEEKVKKAKKQGKIIDVDVERD